MRRSRKALTPSAASRLSSTVWFHSSNTCAAASRDARSAARAEASAACTASGAFAAICWAISMARFRRSAFRHDFVDEAGPQRGVGVEAFGGQQVSHAGGAEPGGQPKRRPAQGKDSARHLELGEARALGGHREL